MFHYFPQTLGFLVSAESPGPHVPCVTTAPTQSSIILKVCYLCLNPYYILKYFKIDSLWL